MKKKYFISYFISYSIIALLTLTFLLNGCNDAPSIVGSGFLSDTVSIGVITGQDTITIPSSSNYLLNSPLERNTGSVLVGECEKIRAGALMRFGIPTGKGNITEDRIVSCELYMFPRRYALGDTAGSNQLNFEIKEVTNQWMDPVTIEPNVTFKDALDPYSNLYIGSRQIYDWNDQIILKDSMDTLIVDFRKDILAEWLLKMNDGANITDTVWGIAILPKTGSTVVNSFMAHSNFSNLTNNITGTFIRVVHYKEGEDSSELDSFDIYSANDYSFVELKEEDNNFEEEDIVIQGGVRLHSSFEFDISQIPMLAAVNYAEFTVFVNENESYSGNIPLPDKISLYYYRDLSSEAKFGKHDLKLTGRYDSTMKAFIFKDYLGVPFNHFVRNLNGKGTMVLAFDDINQELNYLNRYVFYGLAAADISKRPRLKLIYSKI